MIIGLVFHENKKSHVGRHDILCIKMLQIIHLPKKINFKYQ